MDVLDGQSKDTIMIGTHRSFAGMANDLNWVDFWGVVYDKETFEVLIKDDEIKGDRKVFLKNPSVFVRKDEVGDGVITYKNGNYIWVHQSD